MSTADDLKKIAKQELRLVFDKFDEATAFAIGSAIRERALKEKLAHRRRHQDVWTARFFMRRCPGRPAPTPIGRGARSMS